jgi:excisionase family DNA binding protein
LSAFQPNFSIIDVRSGTLWAAASAAKGDVMASDEMLTVAEVAARLKVPPATIRRWLRAKQLHGVMLGGTKLGYRIPASELERFLRAAA